jgi:class 3 adenylate cyclase
MNCGTNHIERSRRRVTEIIGMSVTVAALYERRQCKIVAVSHSGPAGVTPVQTNIPGKGADMSFVPGKRIIVLANLAGCTKAFQSRSDEKMAAFIQEYYVVCDNTLTEAGGTIIKFMGDACLAVFPAEPAKDAVAAVLQLQVAADALASQYQIPVSLGANVHLSLTIDSEFGVGTSKRRDIIGRGVNQTFLLGRGPGIRISEAVYRALPSNARAPWNKHKPPAVYHLGSADGVYDGMGKGPSANAQRW